jgi:hypothetical protein
MLFTFFKIENHSHDLNKIFNCFTNNDNIESVTWNQEKKSFQIFFNNSELSKCVVVQIADYQFLLVNTFDKEKIKNTLSFFSEVFPVSFRPIEIATNEFKKILNTDYQIVELVAIINGPITEEITLSGVDIHEAEFYQLMMEKGEIRKIVIFLPFPQNDQVGTVVKIFFDGKFSIIPEIKNDLVITIFEKIMKGLEIA